MPHSVQETGETVLVVDHNESVLQTVVAILKHSDYQLLSADCGASALRLSSETDAKIDLLLSDVEMPFMSGPVLGATLKTTRPDMHVMLMSGGFSGSLPVFKYSAAFIEKPFLPEELTRMVSGVLRPQFRSEVFESCRNAIWVKAANDYSEALEEESVAYEKRLLAGRDLDRRTFKELPTKPSFDVQKIIAELIEEQRTIDEVIDCLTKLLPDRRAPKSPCRLVHDVDRAKPKL